MLRAAVHVNEVTRVLLRIVLQRAGGTSAPTGFELDFVPVLMWLLSKVAGLDENGDSQLINGVQDLLRRSADL